ncbi:MAG TPA: ABC transporter ATP-binding protein, partial [Patescibacteria group bacterium]|nr:ABC transporter ATP-binding protein [Patescibacteria group bacterium]
AFGLENIALPPAEMPARIEEALASAGALHLAGRSIRTLSGGERQRIALASALAMRPQVVVLDEPTSQLDPEGAAMVLSAAADLAAQGRAVIVSEHRLEHLVALANVLVTIDGGCASLVDISAWRQPDPPPARPCSAPAGREAWSLDGVAAAFGNRSVFEGVDAAGHEGEVVVLTGPNGGGKTTLLRLIAGAVQPRTGRVERRPGRIAYLPQNPTALLHRPTLRAEVALTLERSGEPESPDVILDALGLLPVAGRYPRDLSCGERQRAALAAVLPGTPRLVLLDEPTRGMDVAARDALIALVGRLRDAGSSIVIATHDAVLRRSLGDTVLRVAEGRVDQARAEVATA